VPLEGARGGAETLYPEYHKKLAAERAPGRRGARMTRRTVHLAFRRVAAVGLCVSARLGAQQPQNFDAVQVRVLKAQGNVYMLTGAGGNVTVQAGSDGVLVVDTQYAADVRQAAGGHPRHLDRPDPLHHRTRTCTATTWAATRTSRRRARRSPAATCRATSRTPPRARQIWAHDNVLLRMSDPKRTPAIPTAAWPTSTFTGKDKKLFFNGEGVHLIHEPAAHTDGDSIVFFRRSDVISAGDIFNTTNFPVIDVPGGGTINGIIDGVNHLIELIIPVYGQEGGTMVIPGHGRLSDLGDVLNYREMATIVRDRVQDMKKKGMTLEQVKAARPTRDYDPLYNPPGAFYTADQFVEAVYRTLP
jgi:glyoxylase-like metal-dependent hydrolase (beta-lactamase superfamily II)